MARQKKPTYEWVERLNCYRKRIKDVDGKYVAIYGSTPDELAEKVEAAKQAIEEELRFAGNPLVKDYAADWLEAETTAMKPANKAIYENAINIHIVPALGNMRLRDVKPDDARRVMLAMAGKSASLQGKVLNIMRRMFDNALDNDLIAKNPCAKLKNTGYKTAEKVALTKEQEQTLLDAVKGTRAETFVMLGLYTGMRREEILGLKWDCVDLESKVKSISVKRALRWENSRPVVSNELKTDAAKRTIPIPDCLADYLSLTEDKTGHVIGREPLTQTQFKNLWRIVENRMVGPKTYRDPVSKKKMTFVREKGAKSTSGSFFYTIDFDVTPHILRHTYITNLILSGANIKVVQYLAGHSSVDITLNIYTHIMNTNPDTLFDAVKGAFEVKKEVNQEQESFNT